MRAMVLHVPCPADSRPLTLEERPVPPLPAGCALIKVLRCGVCHTDLHIVEGDLAPQGLPRIPGHQVVGIVEAVADDVSTLERGARVGVAWLFAACGRCAFCQRGEENLCLQAQFTGYHVDGGYAEYMVARADYVFPLPPQFADTAAAPLLCAGIIGYRALHLAGVRPQSRVGLYGFGASAHLAIQVARFWDCAVSVVTRQPAHQRLAASLGAAWVGGPADQPPQELDSAIVFAPSGAVVIQALQAVRRGGTVAINAIHLGQIPAFDYAWLYWERTLRSVSNCTRQDAREFLDLAARIPVRVETSVFPLEEANQALLALRRGEITGAAVLTVA